MGSLLENIKQTVKLIEAEDDIFVPRGLEKRKDEYQKIKTKEIDDFVKENPEFAKYDFFAPVQLSQKGKKVLSEVYDIYETLHRLKSKANFQKYITQFDKLIYEWIDDVNENLNGEGLIGATTMTEYNGKALIDILDSTYGFDAEDVKSNVLPYVIIPLKK